MPQTRIPSPARSQGAPVTPRRYKPRGTRSVGSPARSTSSGRLSALIQLKETTKDSFVLSPAPSRRSVLNDDTDIEEPRRRSWWKKLGDNSRDVMEILKDDKVLDTNAAVEEYIDIEVLSQEKKNLTVELPDSSDGESISSIVIPQRKLFTHKDQHNQNKFEQLIGNRETLAKLHKSNVADKTVNVPPKNLFGQNKKRSKPIFPAALLNISPNKTVNKSKELKPAEVKGQVRNLFGNNGGTKRKNMFADFIVSESEDEIPEIQPKVFGFPKKTDQRRNSTTSHGKKEHSPTSSITTDIEMDEWRQLPSSTMVDNQLEDMMAAAGTPKKRPRLSNLEVIMESAARATADNENGKPNDVESELSEEEQDERLNYEDDEPEEMIQNAIEENDEEPNKESQNDNFLENSTEKDTKAERKICESESRESELKSKNNCDTDIEKSDKFPESEEKSQDINKADPQKQIETQDQNDIETQASELEMQNTKDDEEQQESDADASVVKGQDEIEMEVPDQNDDEDHNEVDRNEPEVSAQDSSDAEVQSESEDDAHESNEAEVEHESETEIQNTSQANEFEIGNHEQSGAEEQDESDADSETEAKETRISEGKVSDIEAPEESEVEEENASNANEQIESDAEAQNESEAEEQNESEAKEQSVSEAEEQNENEEEEQNESEEEKQNESEAEEQNESETEMQGGDEENESEELQYDETDEIQNQSDRDETQIESEDEIEASDDQEIQNSEIRTETPNVSHDTTGRNRKKNQTDLDSPEAILHDKTNQVESFTAQGRNTSIRKTTLLKNLNIRPSLAPPRESTGLSDGTRNSSAEGSGWDSHRTTRKTLRQTFGKDFTPRKSLRAMVMEKSAKRQTAVNEITSVTSKFPQANSTELPDVTQRGENFDADDDIENIPEANHDVSKRTRQTTLETYLQKIKEQNMEKKLKMEEAVRNSLKASSRDTINLFKVPSKSMFPVKKAAKLTQNKAKAKPVKSLLIPLEDLPQEVIEDMKYKPPRRFQPSNASWITKRLYKFLESKLESKYDYKARVRAEKLVETIYHFAKELRRHDVAPHDAVDVLKHEMARLDVVKTHFEFYQFFHDFMPREIRVKVVPDVVNKISVPRHGVFSDILRGNNVKG